MPSLIPTSRPEKLVFPETGQVKIVLLLTGLHSRMCIRICIFCLKNTHKHINTPTNRKKKKLKKKREYLLKI